MNQEASQSLSALYKTSFSQNWELPMFSDYGGSDYSYAEAAQQINRLQHFMNESGLKKGDKVSLLGRNSSLWGISFLAVMSYGAVAVPVLPDFNPSDIHHIINHSESKLLLAADPLFEKLKVDEMPKIQAVVSLVNFELLFEKSEIVRAAWGKSLKADVLNQITAQELQFQAGKPDGVCVISYTSGTSGFTKGVMIPNRSLLSNLIYARDHMPLKSGEKIVSFLPMAHVFGLLFEFLFPSTLGCHITFLTKAPTPQVIIKAFKEIQPHLILSVPLVIEKIYKKQILPTLEKPVMKILLRMPGISSIIHKKIKEKLVETFGGRFYEIVIGGAALSGDVETFFRKIGFPFTVGYGMTECGPLISYDDWNTTHHSSAGRLVDRMEVRIDSSDPFRVAGEILVKGDNVMLGYYKNDEATKQVLNNEGWLNTGDLGTIDSQNYIYIKGRSKNMLLGPSGQNIYPEEIEAKLVNLHGIQEAVVVNRDGKLVALVFPDPDVCEAEHLDKRALTRLMERNGHHINHELPKYSQISKVELVEEEFEKTPKRNIKRFLYT